MASSEVNLLFLPYEPKGSTKNKTVEPSKSTGTKTTWQKHAAREYHRRNADKKDPSAANRRKRYHVTPVQRHAQPSKAPDKEIPTTNDAVAVTEDDEEHEQFDMWSPIGQAASDQIDPFGMIIRPGMSKYAIEMFHHCM